MNLRAKLRTFTRRVKNSPAAVTDAIMIGAFSAIMLALFLQYDLFDMLIEFMETHEDWELDEYFSVLIVVGTTGFIYALRRMTELRREIRSRRKAEERATRLAMHDPLTGLPNRRKFDLRFREIVDKTRENAFHAVMMLDMDGFKPVNDAFGHSVGDALLNAFAERLEATIGEEGCVARLGGDEFAILTGDLDGPMDATRLARQLVSVFQEPFVVDGLKINVSTGIGVALYPEDGAAADRLLRRADIALYRAKGMGRGNFCFFEHGMDEAITRRALIENRLRAAIASEEIEPHFQPIQNLANGNVVAFEALARWTDAELGYVPPDQFIGVAEDSGLIAPLSDMLLRKSLEAASKWPDHISLSYNLSAVQLQDRALSIKILSITNALNFDPHRLEIEVTEGALVRDMEIARDTLLNLSNAGIKIALDDFGTGHSSLRYIREFHIDKLKIDQSFVQTLKSKPESELIIRAILGLSHGLGVETTAEGIEDEEQLRVLIGEGCELGQGYLFGKALPPSEALALVALQAHAQGARKSA